MDDTAKTLPPLHTPIEHVYDMREEWLKARRTGIGSSDAPAMLGLTKWATRLSIWLSKRGEDGGESKAEAERLKWGHRLEGPILDGFGEDVGRAVKHCHPFTILEHPSNPLALASLDGLQEDPNHPEKGLGIAEAKNLGPWKRDEWMSNGVPEMYRVQLQHQLYVSGLRWGSVIGLIGGAELVYQDFDRDEEFIAFLVKEEETFWQSIVDGIAPQPTGLEVDAMALASLYHSPRPTIVQLPPEVVVLDDELAGVSEQRKGLEKREAEIKNLVKAAIGDNTFGVLPSGAAWKWAIEERKESITKASSSRVLRRVKGPK